ncbi:Hypothetical protein A7982_00319 [Minicystis rosea]|nr:Hypothetical protein A7982_00319 [Minicystis rosea]
MIEQRPARAATNERAPDCALGLQHRQRRRACQLRPRSDGRRRRRRCCSRTRDGRRRCRRYRHLGRAGRRLGVATASRKEHEEPERAAKVHVEADDTIRSRRSHGRRPASTISSARPGHVANHTIARSHPQRDRTRRSATRARGRSRRGAGLHPPERPRRGKPQRIQQAPRTT